jgi:hypothetical protein
MNLEKEKILFSDLAQIIEHGKQQVAVQVNSVLTLTYWQVGKKINEHILQSERAEYGKQIVINLAKKLEQQFGKSFAERNLRRMMQFAENFPTFEIVSPLVSQLSWTHFIVLNSVKNPEARQFYAPKKQ